MTYTNITGRMYNAIRNKFCPSVTDTCAKNRVLLHTEILYIINIINIITPYIRMLDSDWLIAVIFVLQIQALHFEFAEFLLHVGVFA
jgi:hypothetical protein